MGDAVTELQRADHAVEIDDRVRPDPEHAIERKQTAGRRLRGASILDLDPAQAVAREKPASVAWIERRDRVAALAHERRELRPLRDELHELTTRDVDPDAVALAARTAVAALVPKAPIRPREVDAFAIHYSSPSVSLPRRAMFAARPSSL